MSVGDGVGDGGGGVVVGDYVAERISPTSDDWETIQTDLGCPEDDLVGQSANPGGQVGRVWGGGYGLTW